MERTSIEDLVGATKLAGVSEDRALRFNSGKPQLSLVFEFRYALEAIAIGLEEGVSKYGRGNWQKGMPTNEIIDSMGRHLIAHMSGEVVDQDSSTGATHLAKIACNALMALELELRKQRIDVTSLDDQERAFHVADHL